MVSLYTVVWQNWRSGVAFYNKNIDEQLSTHRAIWSILFYLIYLILINFNHVSKFKAFGRERAEKCERVGTWSSPVVWNYADGWNTRVNSQQGEKWDGHLSNGIFTYLILAPYTYTPFIYLKKTFYTLLIVKFSFYALYFYLKLLIILYKSGFSRF